ncbi:hypothetical protein ZWY2020_013384 [Hordeum vulgare]|nr:hypothetical protein ZWY2020_013384 [Hordeum vulgare]
MTAARSCTDPCWSDLPADLLTSIVQRLQLPGAVAFASVCTSWRAAAGGIPDPRTPWLMSWEQDPHPAVRRGRSAVTCKFRSLLDADRVYSLTFPEGTFVTCCGASNGWLVVVDELCNLSLHNPFTSQTIALPPVTDFPCVTAAVHDERGKIKAYRLSRSSGEYVDARQYDAYHLATYFYWKAELSGNPSGGGDYAVTVVHFGGQWISHVRAGDTRWRVLVANSIWGHGHPDAYADCAYHKGSVYGVSYQGIVQRWNLDGAGAGTPSEKREEVVQGRRLRDAVLARHLVASPGGGGLWLVSAVWEPGREEYPDAVRFTFRVVDDDDDDGGEGERESVQAHALFVGMNRPAWLPAGTGSFFSGVRPGVLYFSAPWMRQYSPSLLERVRDWGGARAYGVLGKTRTRAFDRVFPGLLPESARLMDCPTEVWVTPNPC